MSDRPETDIASILQLVSHLGGPECTSEELRWAIDIPAGKQLFEWLAGQVPPEVASNASDTAMRETGAYLEAAVSPIALYPEERNALTGLHHCGADNSRVQAGTPYELPSQLRSRTIALDDDAELLEKHAARLKHRLTASKIAAKDLKQTIHTLRAQIQRADETIGQQQVRLADLSVEADGTVARVTSLAMQALQDTGKEDPNDALKAEISTLSGSRAAVTTATKTLYRILDEGYAALPNPNELQQDAEAVKFKLNILARDRLAVQKVIDAAYVEELEKMTGRIETAQNAEVVAQLLREATSLDARDGGDLQRVDVDVKGELERAGQMDRLALLRAQEKGLDTFTSYMHEELVPRLQQTYDNLHARSTLVIETEAVVSALIEELEDVNDAVESTRRLAVLQRPQADGIEEELENQLIELLKGLLTSEADKPTVLLDRSDIKSELSSLAERVVAARKTEEDWATGLRFRLNELSNSTAPLLASTYTNSPVNTSPPFAPSAGQMALQEETHSKAEELMSAAARLQKETELSSRDKRKLGTFVEKWLDG